MDTELNGRGIVIGERYRVAGTLRRTGVIEAIDLDADQGMAACRIIGIPGDAAAVDAWEDAWRQAEMSARLPRLLEVVTDDDGSAWAALAAADGTAATLPSDARRQAYAMGMELAKAGLDVADITSTMLVANSRGQLMVDGIPFLGGVDSPRIAAERLAAMLPPDPVDQSEADWVEPPIAHAPRRRRSTRSRRRLLIPGAIGLAMLAAIVALLMPARSAGTSVPSATIEAPPADVLLGDVAHPVIAADATVTITVTEPARPARVDQSRQPSETVDRVGVDPAMSTVPEAMPAPAAPNLPLVDPLDGVVLPLNSAAPSLPLGN